jgi:hypothetical protein
VHYFERSKPSTPPFCSLKSTTTAPLELQISNELVCRFPVPIIERPAYRFTAQMAFNGKRTVAMGMFPALAFELALSKMSSKNREHEASVE